MSSEDHDQQDKHLPASEQKLKKAREEGQVPRSRDLASLLLLGGAFVLFATTGGELFTQLASLVSQGLTIDPSAARDIEKMSAQAARLSSNALLLSVPLLFLLVVASVLGCVAVGGWNYSLQAIQPQGSRIDPITGFGRILCLHWRVYWHLSCGSIGKVPRTWRPCRFGRHCLLPDQWF